MRILPLILSTLSFLSGAVSSGGQPLPRVSREQVDEVIDLAWDMGEAWRKGELPDPAFTEEELAGLVRSLQRALASNRLEDLADLSTVLPPVLTALSQTESGRHYAAWLLQRYDYAVVAGWSAEEAREKAAEAKAPPPPEAVDRFRDEYVMDLRVWRTRLADRRPPDGAARWLPLVKGVFADRGVPEALVWLAEVESSFDPEAVSPVGARGLFQFMPETGEWMGLSLRPEDERLDPAKSAEAAAGYLRYLYERFESWPLVLAAYNAGEGRVGRLLESRAASDFNGIARFLPAETRMYVPKVFATIELREGGEAAALPPPRP
ncbi:MAG: lytic transglycosylase domain-containing protein [Puniceicoccaceae bacterium]